MAFPFDASAMADGMTFEWQTITHPQYDLTGNNEDATYDVQDRM
jgi:hypothetical protein